MRTWRVSGLHGAHLTAPCALAVIFLGLIARGANDAALSSYLSFALLAALFVAIGAAPAGRTVQFLSANAVSIAAALGFIALALLTTLPSDALPDFAVLTPPLAQLDGRGSAPLSLSPYRTIEGVGAFMAPLAAYALGFFSAPDRDARAWTVRCFAFFTTLYALWALSGTYGGASGRLDAGLGSANAAATVFGMLAVLAGAQLARAGNIDAAAALPAWARAAAAAPLALVALTLALTCVMLTASRAGILASAIGMLAFGLALLSRRMGDRTRAWIFLAPLIGLAGLGAFLFLSGDTGLGRYAAIGMDIEARETLITTHWAAFLKRPWLGYGLNTYHEISSIFSTPENWQALRSAGSAHNIYIQALEETGIVGGCLFALMLAPPLLRASARVIAGQSNLEWSAAICACAALCLLHGLVDFGLQVPAIAALFTFMLGALAGAADRERR